MFLDTNVRGNTMSKVKWQEKERVAHRAQEQLGSWDRIFPVSICTQELRLFHSPLSVHRSCQERAGLPRSALPPELRGEMATFSSITVQSWTSQESTGHRNSGAAGTGSFWSPSAPGSQSVPLPTVHSLPGESWSPSSAFTSGLSAQWLDIKLTPTNQWPSSAQRLNRPRRKLGNQNPSQ